MQFFHSDIFILLNGFRKYVWRLTSPSLIINQIITPLFRTLYRLSTLLGLDFACNCRTALLAFCRHRIVVQREQFNLLIHLFDCLLLQLIINKTIIFVMQDRIPPVTAELAYWPSSDAASKSSVSSSNCSSNSSILS